MTAESKMGRDYTVVEGYYVPERSETFEASDKARQLTVLRAKAVEALQKGHSHAFFELFWHLMYDHKLHAGREGVLDVAKGFFLPAFRKSKSEKLLPELAPGEYRCRKMVKSLAIMAEGLITVPLTKRRFGLTVIPWFGDLGQFIAFVILISMVARQIELPFGLCLAMWWKELIASAWGTAPVLGTLVQCSRGALTSASQTITCYLHLRRVFAGSVMIEGDKGKARYRTRFMVPYLGKEVEYSAKVHRYFTGDGERSQC